MSEITIAKMQKDIDHITENISDIKGYIQEDREWKKGFAECLDNRYASKRIERKVDAIELLFLVGIVGALLALIIK